MTQNVDLVIVFGIDDCVHCGIEHQRCYWPKLFESVKICTHCLGIYDVDSMAEENAILYNQDKWAEFVAHHAGVIEPKPLEVPSYHR